MKRIELVKNGQDELSIRKRCELLSITRSHIYYNQKERAEDVTTLMNEIQELYAKRPFQGYKRITKDLQENGYKVNHKRIYRLMKFLGLQAIYPKKNLSKRRQKDAIFPYLLKKYPALKAHDVWSVDITYIKTSKGFAYLTAIIDIFSRCIMGWNLSPTLDTQSSLEALEMALKTGYKPKILNSDQGCQFTSDAWIWKLVEHKIEISMDGKGRWADNIYIERFWRTLKYEEVYLKTYDSMGEAKQALKAYIHWYNHHRRHTSLDNKRPYDVMIDCENVENANTFSHSSTSCYKNVENTCVFTHNFVTLTETTTSLNSLFFDNLNGGASPHL